jgi:hypothetical protein
MLCIIATIGVVMLPTIHKNIRARDAALFLVVTGIYTASPVVICWFSMNVVGHTKEKCCYCIPGKSFPIATKCPQSFMIQYSFQLTRSASEMLEASEALTYSFGKMHLDIPLAMPHHCSSDRKYDYGWPLLRSLSHSKSEQCQTAGNCGRE